jgi:hypothetical protein
MKDSALGLGDETAAKGGIMTLLSSHVPAYASGGVISKPSLAWIGEGRNREAIVPLPDGRAIPAVITEPKASGGGNTFVTHITVPINTTAGASGDSRSAAQLGNIIAQAVEMKFSECLLKNLRPGGMLNRGRS